MAAFQYPVCLSRYRELEHLADDRRQRAGRPCAASAPGAIAAVLDERAVEADAGIVRGSEIGFRGDLRLVVMRRCNTRG